jgi:hypothetical protein
MFTPMFNVDGMRTHALFLLDSTVPPPQMSVYTNLINDAEIVHSRIGSTNCRHDRIYDPKKFFVAEFSSRGK